MDKTLETTLKAGLNTKMPICDAEEVFHDDEGTYKNRMVSRKRCHCRCRRETNKGESGFSKASDRGKAEDHGPQGVPVVVW